jgi:hypothetical protein
MSSPGMLRRPLGLFQVLKGTSTKGKIGKQKLRLSSGKQVPRTVAGAASSTVQRVDENFMIEVPRCLQVGPTPTAWVSVHLVARPDLPRPLNRSAHLQAVLQQGAQAAESQAVKGPLCREYWIFSFAVDMATTPFTVPSGESEQNLRKCLVRSQRQIAALNQEVYIPTFATKI